MILKFDRSSKNNRASFSTISSLCIISKPLVNSNWSYSQATLNWCGKREFLSSVNLKFDRWHWKSLGHLFSTNSSFVCNLKAIDEFKLDWLSGNTQLGSKLATIWKMTLKKNRVPSLWHIKFCASFCSHRWTQTGVTNWKLPISIKNGIFPMLPWNLTDS